MASEESERDKTQHDSPGPSHDTCRESRKRDGDLQGICEGKDTEADPDPDPKRLCLASSHQHDSEGSSNDEREVDRSTSQYRPDTTTRDKGEGGAPNRAGSSSSGGTNPAASSTTGTRNERPADTVPKVGSSSKRKRLSISQKVEVIELVREKRMKRATVAQKFGIAERTLSRVISQSSAIQKACSGVGGAGLKKAMRSPRFPEVSRTVGAALKRSRQSVSML